MSISYGIIQKHMAPDLPWSGPGTEGPPLSSNFGAPGIAWGRRGEDLEKKSTNYQAVLAPEAAARPGAGYNWHICIGNPVSRFSLTFLPKIIDSGRGYDRWHM